MKLVFAVLWNKTERKVKRKANYYNHKAGQSHSVE